jgi:zinc protease
MSLPVHRYPLRNGMTVVLISDPTATLATMVVRYAAGAVDDPVHAEGVAHLAAHLVNDERAGATTLATQLERIAIGIDIEPRPTETLFFSRFAPEHLDAALTLEAVQMKMGCDRIDDAALAAERSDLMTELATHPSWRLNRIVGEAIYPADDPMRRAYAADAETVRSITRDQVCDFIARRYAPGNATLVVTGPISTTELEKALGPLNDVAARPFDPPATMPGAVAPTQRLEVSADVPEPTLAVAFPIPRDAAERTRAFILLDRIGAVLHAGELGDGRYLVLWIPLGPDTVDARLTQVVDALAGSVDALGVRPARRFTGRLPIRRDAFDRPEQASFDRTRARYVAEELAGLDDVLARVAEVASGTDLDKTFTTLGQLDEASLRRTLARSLDVSRAQVIVLHPDASRPMTRFSELVEPAHELRRRLELDAASEHVAPQIPKSLLGRATSFRLSNGLNVVLAPSSTIPVVDVRLVFAAGIAASPVHRIAYSAIAALMWAVIRASSEHGMQGIQLNWNARWDSVELSSNGTASDVDTRIRWFSGLSKASRTLADTAGRGISDAEHSTIATNLKAMRDDVFRSHVYGNHPYGMLVENVAPVARLPKVEEVEQFYRDFLQPDDATLVITGGFDPADVMRAVHDAFDGWTGTARPLVIPPPTPGAGAALGIVESSPWIDVHLGWQAGPPDGDYAAREIVVEMIDRLQPDTRCSYVAHRFGGHYEVRGVFDPGTAAAEIVGLRRAISALGDGSDASRQLFAVARRAVVMKAAAGPVSSAQWAMALVHAVELGHDLAWRQQLAERVAQVQYDDVKRVLTTELRTDLATWLVTGPEQVLRDVYGQLGLVPTISP